LHGRGGHPADDHGNSPLGGVAIIVSKSARQELLTSGPHDRRIVAAGPVKLITAMGYFGIAVSSQDPSLRLPASKQRG
jgi:hypothetical protein